VLFDTISFIKDFADRFTCVAYVETNYSLLVFVQKTIPVLANFS